MEKFFVGLCPKQNEYLINGVRYIVTSEFLSPENNPTLTEKKTNHNDEMWLATSKSMRKTLF